ncbi:MAG: helix-turn-helix domain-containing protein [Clostridia bacterium]|nr:helix-turn-helix domain-containing protein [Clostridia bacterium]MBR5015305.1 helix-turn-helix domain-containing protein [Clostridia bacterium]
MKITSAMLFYQLSKKCDFVEKRAPSNKLQIENIRFYNGKTEVGLLYLVDCKRLEKAIVAKKPCSLIFINAEDLNHDYIPKNCDYAIFKNVRNFFDLAEIVYECIDDLQTWDCKLKDGLVNRIPLDEFGAIAQDIIKEPLYIMTHNFSLLALSGKHSYDFLEEDIENIGAEEAIHKSNFGRSLAVKYVRRLISDREYENSMERTDIYEYSDSRHNKYLCMNIFSDNRYIARLMAPIKYYGEEADEGFVQLFRHFFDYLKQVYLRYTDDPLIKNTSDKLHILIDDMLFSSEKLDDVDANLILQNYSWGRNDRYTVIKFTFFKNSKWDEMTEYIRGKLEETWSNSCAVIHDDYIVWVFNHSLSKNSEDTHRFFHVLAYILRDFVCKAGVSDEFTDINRVASYLTQANMALVTGQKNDPNKWYFRFRDYALDYMYDCVMTDLSYDQLISENVRKLIDYDKKNNTEYLKTLRCYIENNCNSTHTAEELFIHRTTLIRRIERITELCDIDFDDPDEKMYLALSFLILHKMSLI